MLWECVFYAAVYPSTDRGVRFGWESIFGVTGLWELGGGERVVLALGLDSGSIVKD